ncbi:MAG: hypothetical protein ACLRLU_06620 [Haemophilus parainfluenzae]
MENKIIYNYLRKFRDFIENSPKIFLLLIGVIVASWVGNFIISNDINIFSDRPNVRYILNILSMAFSFFTALYAVLEFFYSKIDDEDKKINESKFDNIEKYNRVLVAEISSKEKNIRANCRNILEKIFIKFALDNSSRITLFYCKESCRKPTEFHILERYAIGGGKDHYQPEASYLISIGFIKYVWENGFYSDIEKCPVYPESGKKIAQKRKDYNKYQLDSYGITEDMIKNMNMKSCDFIGKNLSNDLANLIILFESNKNGKLSHITEDKLNKFLDSTFLREHLISHVELLNWISSKQSKLPSNTNEITSRDIRNEFNRS